MDSIMTSASDIQMDYMKLLIAQMQNQNPLEPLDNNEMASQLAQFTQLQQLESVNTRLETMSLTFAEVLSSVNRTYATSLIGKEVSFFGETEEGTIDIIRGVVERVYREDDKDILIVGDYALGLRDVISVSN